MADTVLAVDVGGTKFAAALVDADGAIRSRANVATPASDDPDIVAEALQDVLARALTTGPAGVTTAAGIGSAGPVDLAAGTVSPVNIAAWRGFDLVHAVSRAVPGVAVRLAGDGHCMALGEHWQGGHWQGGHASRCLLGIVVSTGVGGGLVLDGELYLGPTGNAGHIGHMSVQVDGDVCPCGGRGCVEAIASGPAMVRWALAQGWRSDHREMQPDARHLAQDARSGDPVAREAFRRAADALAAGIVSASALVDVDDVVIGGGVAAAGDVLFTPLREAIGARAGLGFVRRARLHASLLGPDAGLLGAAALALRAAQS